MRIRVAIAAFREWDPREARSAASGGRRMALLACHLRVQSYQRKFRRVVAELGRCLPIDEIVALETVLAELSAMRVLMARLTILRESQERSVQVLYLNQRTSGRAYMLRRMALIARHTRVLALQRIAGLVVIECLLRRNPVDEGEVFAVMLRMTLRAIVLIVESRMEAAPSGNFLRDFRVAALAVQHR